MANQKKDSLSTLFSEEVHGPFVIFFFIGCFLKTRK